MVDRRPIIALLMCIEQFWCYYHGIVQFWKRRNTRDQLSRVIMVHVLWIPDEGWFSRPGRRSFSGGVSQAWFKSVLCIPEFISWRKNNYFFLNYSDHLLTLYERMELSGGQGAAPLRGFKGADPPFRENFQNVNIKVIDLQLFLNIFLLRKLGRCRLQSIWTKQIIITN